MKQQIELTCKADLSDGFELAIEQLGYQIIDSSWDDNNNIMNYTVIKNK